MNENLVVELSVFEFTNLPVVGEYVSALDADEIFVRQKMVQQRRLKHWNDETKELIVLQDLQGNLYWIAANDSSKAEKIILDNGSFYYMIPGLSIQFAPLLKELPVTKPIPHIGSPDLKVSVFLKKKANELCFIQETELKVMFHKNFDLPEETVI